MKRSRRCSALFPTLYRPHATLAAVQIKGPKDFERIRRNDNYYASNYDKFENQDLYKDLEEPVRKAPVKMERTVSPAPA